MSEYEDRVHRIAQEIIDHFNTIPLPPLRPFRAGDYKWDGFKLSAGNTATAPVGIFPHNRVPSSFRSWAAQSAEEAADILTLATGLSHTAEDLWKVLTDPKGAVYIWLVPQYKLVAG